MNTTSPVSSRRGGMRYLTMLAAFVVIVAGIRAAEPILNPLLLAVFVAVICAPAYLALLRRGNSQVVSLLLVSLGLLLVAGGPTIVLVDSLRRFTSDEQQQHYRKQIVVRQEEVWSLVKGWLPSPKKEESTSSQNRAVDPDDSAVAPDSGSDSQDRPATPATGPPDVVAGASFDELLSEDRSSDTAETASMDPETDAADDTSLSDTGGSGSTAVSRAEGDSGASSMKDAVDELFQPRVALSLATQLARSLTGLLSNALMILLTVVFILLEVGSFEGKLNRAFPGRGNTSEQAAEMVGSVQRYMAIKTGVSLATALLVGVWLKMTGWLLLDRMDGVDYVGLWMLLAFLLNFIPNIGSILAAIPAVMISWLDLGVTPAVGVAAGYLIVNVVIGNLVEPRLMGKGLGLSPLVVFCSMVFWGWVLGPVGMLLSAPLTMVVHIVLSGFDDTRWIATLMGTGVAD